MSTEATDWPASQLVMARADGWDAWNRGESLVDCPHDFGSPLSTSWKLGWIARAAEVMRQEREAALGRVEIRK